MLCVGSSVERLCPLLTELELVGGGCADAMIMLLGPGDKFDRLAASTQGRSLIEFEGLGIFMSLGAGVNRALYTQHWPCFLFPTTRLRLRSEKSIVSSSQSCLDISAGDILNYSRQRGPIIVLAVFLNVAFDCEGQRAIWQRA